MLATLSLNVAGEFVIHPHYRTMFANITHEIGERMNGEEGEREERKQPRKPASGAAAAPPLVFALSAGRQLVGLITVGRLICATSKCFEWGNIPLRMRAMPLTPINGDAYK